MAGSLRLWCAPDSKVNSQLNWRSSSPAGLSASSLASILDGYLWLLRNGILLLLSLRRWSGPIGAFDSIILLLTPGDISLSFLTISLLTWSLLWYWTISVGLRSGGLLACFMLKDGCINCSSLASLLLSSWISLMKAYGNLIFPRCADSSSLSICKVCWWIGFIFDLSWVSSSM